MRTDFDLTSRKCGMTFSRIEKTVDDSSVLTEPLLQLPEGEIDVTSTQMPPEPAPPISLKWGRADTFSGHQRYR